MLALQFLRENKEAILKGLEKRNFKQPELIDSIIELDQERRSQQATLDQQLARANQLAKEIGSLFKNGEAEKTTVLKEETATSNHKRKRFKNNYKKLQMRFLNYEHRFLMSLTKVFLRELQKRIMRRFLNRDPSHNLMKKHSLIGN